MAQKKRICGNEWDAERMTKVYRKKWVDFFGKLDITERNVQYLLDFAGYKEKGGKIDKASS